MGTSSGRLTKKTNTMPNKRNRHTQADVIDLTESFTLNDHNHLDNVVINLDDTNHEEQVIPQDPRRRKRRHSSTNIPLQTSVVDLSTPEGKKQPKKSNKEPEKALTIEEPADKRARRSAGTCPVCFEEFAGQALVSTKCGHVFCLQCIQMALHNKPDPRCPTCRTPLKGRNRYHPIFF